MIADRVNNFLKEYIELCNKHGLCITYDMGGLPNELQDLRHQGKSIGLHDPSKHDKWELYTEELNTDWHEVPAPYLVIKEATNNE